MAQSASGLPERPAPVVEAVLRRRPTQHSMLYPGGNDLPVGNPCLYERVRKANGFSLFRVPLYSNTHETAGPEEYSVRLSWGLSRNERKEGSQ